MVLIDPKEYFEDATAQPRALLSCGETYGGASDQESAWATSVCLYKDFVIQHGELITGELVAVQPTHVEVGATRAAVPYDYLVLCTGSSYSSSIKTNNASLAYRHQQMLAERDALREAQHVLIVGGGLVGVELAGEIAEALPAKRVTLVHSHERLLRHIKGAHELAAATLEKLGVRLLLGERLQRCASSDAVQGGAGTFVTSKGTRIEADKVLWATGYTPNTAYLRHEASDAALSAALDPSGFVRVDASMRVEGFDHVFACGDLVSAASRCRAFATISDGVGGGHARPERTANAASFAAFVVSENIRRLHGARGEAEMVRFDQRRLGNKANVAISLGASQGLMWAPPDPQP